MTKCNIPSVPGSPRMPGRPSSAPHLQPGLVMCHHPWATSDWLDDQSKIILRCCCFKSVGNDPVWVSELPEHMCSDLHTCWLPCRWLFGAWRPQRGRTGWKRIGWGTHWWVLIRGRLDMHAITFLWTLYIWAMWGYPCHWFANDSIFQAESAWRVGKLASLVCRITTKWSFAFGIVTLCFRPPSWGIFHNMFHSYIIYLCTIWFQNITIEST